MTSPIQLLKPYQKDVYTDASRFIAWIAGRQIGKSFTGAMRAVKLTDTRPKHDFLIASPSERQSLEAMEKCKQHIEIKTMDPQKAIMVLEQGLHTDKFKIMPDNTIRLYDYLDELEKVAGALAEEKVLVTGLTVTGDTLEEYFLNKIGGASND